MRVCTRARDKGYYRYFHKSVFRLSSPLVLTSKISDLSFEKTTRHFMQNDTSFCIKQAVVFNRTSTRLYRNECLFYSKIYDYLRGRSTLSTQSSTTPVSAKTAAHIPARPNAERRRTMVLMPLSFLEVSSVVKLLISTISVRVLHTVLLTLMHRRTSLLSMVFSQQMTFSRLRTVVVADLETRVTNVR